MNVVAQWEEIGEKDQNVEISHLGIDSGLRMSYKDLFYSTHEQNILPYML